jgi:hypothetical protein
MGAACLVVSQRCPQEDTWQRPLRWPVCKRCRCGLGDGYEEMKRSLRFAGGEACARLEDTHSTQAASASLHCLESLGFLGSRSSQHVDRATGRALASCSTRTVPGNPVVILHTNLFAARSLRGASLRTFATDTPFKFCKYHHLTVDCGQPA